MTVKSKLRLNVGILKRNCSVNVTFTAMSFTASLSMFSKVLGMGQRQHTTPHTYSFLSETSQKMINYLRTLQVLTCHVLKQVMCTHFLHESTILFEERVMFYTSA
jgi:hypothetical protein